MAAHPAQPDAPFPLHGARARHFARFERDFETWLDTADGRFAVWQAREPCWVQAARARRDAEERARRA